jgi:hypothetical protein
MKDQEVLDSYRMSPTKNLPSSQKEDADKFSTPQQSTDFSEFSANESSKPARPKSVRKKQTRDPDTPVRRSNRTKKPTAFF